MIQYKLCWRIRSIVKRLKQKNPYPPVTIFSRFSYYREVYVKDLNERYSDRSEIHDNNPISESLPLIG